MYILSRSGLEGEEREVVSSTRSSGLFPLFFYLIGIMEGNKVKVSCELCGGELCLKLLKWNEFRVFKAPAFFRRMDEYFTVAASPNLFLMMTTILLLS